MSTSTQVRILPEHLITLIMNGNLGFLEQLREKEKLEQVAGDGPKLTFVVVAIQENGTQPMVPVMSTALPLDDEDLEHFRSKALKRIEEEHQKIEDGYAKTLMDRRQKMNELGEYHANH